MTRVDLALLSAIEALCRRFQTLTGKTNVWLAFQLTNLSIVVYFVGAAVSFVRLEAWARLGLGLFCAALLYALTQTVFRVPVESYENNAYRRVARGLRNPRRIRDVGLRLSFLALSLLLLYPLWFLYQHLFLPLFLLLSYSLIVLTTVVLYLLACDPLPPCRGSLPGWLRFGARARVPAGNGRPNSA